MKKRQNRPPIRRTEELVLDSIERWGNDVDTAVELALEELKVGRDEVEIEVLEEPSKGFFGIGAKLAKVKVSKKSATAKEEKPAKEKKETRGPIRKEELTEEERESLKDTKKADGRGSRRDGGRKKKTFDETIDKDAEESRYLDEPIMPLVDKESLQALESSDGLEFLKNISEAMELDINIEGRTDGKDQYFFIEGKDSGTIIGKRGATLDAVQYLTSLVVNKTEGDYIRVVVDAENYRAKREKALEKLAVRLADKVARTNRSFKLEPMNPYERKVIHATLQKDGRIITRSEGQDPSRRVIIEPKA